LRLATWLGCLALAVFAAAWAVLQLAAIPQPGLYGMAQGVLRNEIYPPATLQAMIASADPGDCRVEVASSVLIMELRLFDEAMRQPYVPRTDDTVLATRKAAQRLLACAPSSSLGWFALYLTTIRTEGFGSRAIAELSAAYRNAPHEAWLQALRLPVMLTGYAALPDELRRSVQSDFGDLLDADMNRAVAVALTANRVPQDLVTRLCAAPVQQRAYISDELLRLDRESTIPCLVDVRRPAYLR